MQKDLKETYNIKSEVLYDRANTDLFKKLNKQEKLDVLKELKLVDEHYDESK